MTCVHSLSCETHGRSGAPNGRGPRFLEPAEPAIATPLDVQNVVFTIVLLCVWKHAFVIVIVNSILPQRPQKRGRRNQLIHRRLSKSESIGSGSDPESQASRQSDRYGGWCLELIR